jgi:hypothetical protein
MDRRSRSRIRPVSRRLDTATCGELRIQREGRPYRVLYAFDPRRAAILLLGGDKTGNDRWYEEQVPVADRLYDEHLRQLEREGLI